VVLGTDWPAPMAVVDPVNTIKNSAVLSDVEKDAILWGNMEKALE